MASPCLVASLRCSFLPNLLLLSAPLLLIFVASPAQSGSIVTNLPGYDGELPFKLETGYVSVDDSELFYYFIESQGNPQTDPFFLWLTGGPGCSSFNGLIYEIGPMQFDIENYLGGLPKLLPYEPAWTKTASILFLDSPVGTGYSYSTTAANWYSSDSSSAKQAYEFLRKWLADHQQYLSVELYVGGDSYSGMIVPLVTQHIVDGNYQGLEPHLNLRGYLVGSPRTDSVIDENSKIVFAHRMALISDELYEAADTTCNGTFVNVDPSNTECVASLAAINECVEEIWTNDILEPNCAFASPKLNPEIGRRSIKEEHPSEFILSPPRIPELWCRTFNYVLSYIWSNDPSVQQALNVRPGTTGVWKRCNQSLAYTKDIPSVVEVHKNLTSQDLNVLVETGDRDMVVPFVGTVRWIASLNLTVESDWRPWFVDGQVAGYTVQYDKDGVENAFQLTYATVKGAGHTAPEYYRRRCYEMFTRWLHTYYL
ncbi:hypothetical protein MLD38_032144 [Melastoma candidum]|uniref:Uncharacterized protein n=1 Tax=Melastoma candidum TaxID=119954 RepID=A0ACB9M3D5_9MYRT|nr:hypothetical protein MLD38_032144 [Melastoma candidum]